MQGFESSPPQPVHYFLRQTVVLWDIASRCVSYTTTIQDHPTVSAILFTCTFFAQFHPMSSILSSEGSVRSLQAAEPRHLNAGSMVAPGVFLLGAPSAVDLADPDKSQIGLPEGRTLGALRICPGSHPGAGGGEAGGGRSQDHLAEMTDPSSDAAANPMSTKRRWAGANWPGGRVCRCVCLLAGTLCT